MVGEFFLYTVTCIKRKTVIVYSLDSCGVLRNYENVAKKGDFIVLIIDEVLRLNFSLQAPLYAAHGRVDWIM